MKLRGIYPYVISPVDDDGHVMEDALREIVEHLIVSGVDGVCPLGSTGEIQYLSLDARRRITEICINQAAGRVPVLPGIASHSTADAVEQTRTMAEAGADGVVAIQQLYYPVPTSGVVDFFTAVADATPLPVVLYTNPKLGGRLPFKAIVTLADHPNIIAYKDAHGVTGHLLSVRHAVGDKLAIFAASAHVPAFVFEIGGAGWMAGPACLAPRAAVKLWKLFEHGKHEEMWTLQHALWPLNEMFSEYSLAAFIKCGLNAQGFNAGNPVAPQSPLDSTVANRFLEIESDINAVLETLT